MDFKTHILRHVELMTQNWTRYLTLVARNAAELESARFFTWLAELVDKKLPQAPTYFGGVKWPALSRRYRARKAKEYPNSAFFVGPRRGRRSGEETLGHTFWTLSPKTNEVFGGRANTKMAHVRKGHLAVGGTRQTLVITPFPYLDKNLRASNATLSNHIASFASNPTLTRAKLLNRPGAPERPLLQPALTYYIDHMIRRAVNRRLREQGFKVN